MSLLQGSLSLRRLLVLGAVPSTQEVADAVAADQFRPFQDGSEEERMGWCDWRNPIILPADPNWIEQDRFTVLGLRIDTRKVPAGVLKATVDFRLQQLMNEKEIGFVGKEARLSLQDEVKAELLQKVMPSMKQFVIAWDKKGGFLLSDASNAKAFGAITTLFMKSFGCEVQPMAPLLLAGRVCPELPVEGLMALDPMDLTCEVEA